MGSAAANYGLEFEATVNISSGPTSYAIINEAGFANAAVIDKLVRGDEFLVYLHGQSQSHGLECGWHHESGSGPHQKPE